MAADPTATFLEHDQEFHERELASFLPDKFWDMHTHLWAKEAYNAPLPPGFPADATCEDYITLMQPIFPGRQLGGWFLPKPTVHAPEQTLTVSEWTADSVRGKPNCKGAFLIKPQDDPEWVRENVKRLGLSGLKCYHVHAIKKPTLNAEIPEYLPEEIMRVANEEGWYVTLHMVKDRALADPGNQHWIRHYCESFPDMKLILAHSSRGFQPAHNWEGLPKIADLPNVYFDSSANCSPVAHEAILKICGHEHFMVGTDFGAASHTHGHHAPVGDSFYFIYEKSPVWDTLTNPDDKPVLIVLEHLRSIKWAAWSQGLSDTQIEDIFWNNAARLMGAA